VCYPPSERSDAVTHRVTADPGKLADHARAQARGERLRAKQEAQIEQYYAELTCAEREEDAAWDDIAAQSAARLWP
jgi:hypothetical protein